MRNIKMMSENLSNKIAAGEIVTRPISVVKELVENSIDAKSSVIYIELKESGISQIKVSDNGIGMNKENLELCVKRHATSKIYDEDELFKIASLGFRGEALASIYAVSQLEISSSIDGIVGHKLIKKDDVKFEISSCSQNIGTTINVLNLFYNVPARYSGLSNPIYEMSLIVKYIQSVSLIHPNVSFILTNDSHEVYRSHGRGDVLDTIKKIYNSEVSSSMFHVVDNTNNFNIEMFFSNASVSKARRNHIILAVNDRLIRSVELERAIIDSYKNYLHTNQYPICVIKINASYSLLDVNIHPTKQEIKISLIDELIDTISYNIKANLRGKEYINTFKSNITYDDFRDIDINNEDEKQAQFSFNLKTSNNSFVVNDEKQYISKDLIEETDDEKYDLNLISYIGTYLDTYLLFQNSSGLFLVDQHAAQERINYEIIRDKFITHDFNLQNLIVNNVINLTNDEMIVIENKLDDFKELGIILDTFGTNSIRINAADSYYFKGSNMKNDIYNIILEFGKQNISFQDIFDDVAIMMSCKSSIKAHQHLEQNEAEILIEQLKKCTDKYTCPHGRPIIVSFSNYEIEKLFKRVF